jgi:hypothetical protein
MHLRQADGHHAGTESSQRAGTGTDQSPRRPQAGIGTPEEHRREHHRPCMHREHVGAYTHHQMLDQTRKPSPCVPAHLLEQ